MGYTKINDSHVGTYQPMYLPIRGTFPLRRHDSTPYLLSTSTALKTASAPLYLLWPCPVLTCLVSVRDYMLLLLIVASDCITPRHISPHVVALLLAVVVLFWRASFHLSLHPCYGVTAVIVSRPIRRQGDQIRDHPGSRSLPTYLRVNRSMATPTYRCSVHRRSRDSYSGRWNVALTVPARLLTRYSSTYSSSRGLG